MISFHPYTKSVKQVVLYQAYTQGKWASGVRPCAEGHAASK